MVTSCDGPPVVLAGAGRTMYRPLAEELAEYFTVFDYNRRGRGGSGDIATYAVEREIEDPGHLGRDDMSEIAAGMVVPPEAAAITARE
ncbi:MAG: hypothetical protein AVDCRST_MAG05-2969 [uncultured Rubrobacteraceae bacterium]|uniref:Alpha/beta hydrolase n=1 Tax=uncultured Rubrobacteraceae bacterium TaxID=349277 RepID=A0A6J4T0A7_9ACTN|nr:MAG: hypothetical protein AVDCRST_MAG05-2969 [uncultured Rubrobacteraceae bacterium]